MYAAILVSALAGANLHMHAYKYHIIDNPSCTYKRNMNTVFPHIRPAAIIFSIVFYLKVTVHKAEGHST